MKNKIEEIVLLARSKGFVSDVSVIHENYKVADGNVTRNLLNYLLLAEMQKWLRDKHGLIVESVNYFSLTKYALKIHTIEEGEFTGTVTDSTRDVNNRVTYKTYEEALLKGLLEAFKLIKNK